MSTLITQIRELPPSAKEPLFRRLMIAENLAYLREKNSIIGFEINTGVDQALSGFTLIAIQKHTIYAYCSDFDEEPKLILFPPIDKLFDDAFELLDLQVTKRRYTNAAFSGANLGSGSLESLVKDLTPPQKEVDIPQSVASQMAGRIKKVSEGGSEPVSLEKSVEEAPVTDEFAYEPEPEADLNAGYEEEFYDGFDGYEENNFDGYEEDGFDGYEDFESEKEPETMEDERSTKLKAQSFASLSDVSDFCSGQLGVSRSLAVTLVNKALQSDVSPEYRIDLAIKLFCKLFDEKKI